VQSSVSALEFAAKKKLTRRKPFLREIDEVTPCADLMAKIEPFYPRGQGCGRLPIGLVRMCVVQQCMKLSDEGIEDAVYDSQASRGCRYRSGARSRADSTVPLKFRRLLDSHGLTQASSEAPNARLAA